MNIELARAYVANGKTYATLEEAKVAALELLFDNGQTPQIDRKELAQFILARADDFIDVLTTTAKSRPKSRAINGATRKRKKNGPAAVNAALQDQDA